MRLAKRRAVSRYLFKCCRQWGFRDAGNNDSLVRVRLRDVASQ